ncbi:hypothetical protein A9Q98_04360 [Thalassotalea sp. 42_200_T64]|nr:hypothetical protein A9Q98_04360 [Thalassotalea sp. 42_200_T64]
MSDIKFSALWAVSGVVIGFSAISISYWLLHSTIPGYEFLAGPGIVAANFFSEEIDFWPKISIMLTGQYLAYFVAIFAVRKLIGFIGLFFQDSG